MRLIVYLILILIFTSCGTTGHVKFYNFNVSEPKVEAQLRNVINEDSAYSVPEKWADIYANPGPIKYMYVYFSNPPEEMYMLLFTNEAEWKTSPTCQLALVGSFNGDHWAFRKELSSSEMKRMGERFEEEILSKIKYTYTKSN